MDFQKENSSCHHSIMPIYFEQKKKNTQNPYFTNMEAKKYHCT